MKIRFIGTGDGEPSPDRNNSSVLFEGDSAALLVDVGEGSASALKRPVVWKQEIGVLVITHLHADHLSGLPMLLQGWKIQQRTNPLTILAPAPFTEALPKWLSVCRLDPEKLPFPINFRTLREEILELPTGHKITIWENGHIPAAEGGSFSLIVEWKNRKWLYSSDLVDLKALEGHLHGLHGLILETTHVDYCTGVELAKGAGVSTVLLTHIASEKVPDNVEGAIWAEDDLIVEG